MLTGATTSAPGPGHKSGEKMLQDYDFCWFGVRSYACDTLYELIAVWQLGSVLLFGGQRSGRAKERMLQTEAG